MSKWTDDDLAILRAMAAAGETDAAIAKAVGRTPGAVLVQRHRLGLAKRPGPQGQGTGGHGIRVDVTLPPDDYALARELGEGNPAHGVRVLVSEGAAVVRRRRKRNA